MDLMRSTDIGRQHFPQLFEIVEDMRKSLELSARGHNVSISSLMQGKLLGTLFLEPSTRTRLSFEAAMKRMGGDFISVPAGEGSSAKKGESIRDTILTVSQYVDALVVRADSAFGTWGQSFDCPIINGGDGANEHPTQALIDAYTIYRAFGSLENLTVAMVGDLKHGRTVHSLVRLLRQNTNNTICMFGSDMPHPYIQFHNDKIVNLPDAGVLIDYLPKLDVLYMTRNQTERGSDGKEPFILNSKLANLMHPDAIILHPMPRRKEIHPEVDKNERAAYFEQSKNGVPVRMAILQWILGNGRPI